MIFGMSDVFKDLNIPCVNGETLSITEVQEECLVLEGWLKCLMCICG